MSTDFLIILIISMVFWFSVCYYEGEPWLWITMICSYVFFFITFVVNDNLELGLFGVLVLSVFLTLIIGLPLTFAAVYLVFSKKDDLIVAILFRNFIFEEPNDLNNIESFTHRFKGKLKSPDIDYVISIFYCSYDYSKSFLRINIIYDPQIREKLKSINLYSYTYYHFILRNNDLHSFVDAFSNIETFCDFSFDTIKKNSYELVNRKLEVGLLFGNVEEKIKLHQNIYKAFNQSLKLSSKLAESPNLYLSWLKNKSRKKRKHFYQIN